MYYFVAAGNKGPTPTDRVALAFRILCEASRIATLIQDLSLARILISEVPKRAVYATRTVAHHAAITVPYPVSNKASDALPSISAIFRASAMLECHALSICRPHVL